MDAAEDLSQERGRLQTLRDATRGLAASGDWGPNARALNAELVALDPRDGAALARLARCHEAAGDSNAAIDLYRRALGADPSLTVAARGLSRLEVVPHDRQPARLSEARAFLDAGRLEDAEVACRALLEMGVRDRGPIQILLARVRRRSGHPAEAAQLCQRVIAGPRRDLVVRALTVLGASRADEGLIEEAEWSVRQALAMAPDDLAALRILGRILAMGGDPDGSRAVLARVRRASPPV